MKHQVDKGKTDREFVVGDFVYVKLQPYIQGSVATRASHKHSFKFFGPYEIIQHIGKVTYKPRLPESAAVHSVFHVSEIKPSVHPPQLVSSSMPTANLCSSVPCTDLGSQNGVTRWFLHRPSSCVLVRYGRGSKIMAGY